MEQGTQEQEQAWVREHFQKANRFMAEKGILPGKVVLKESRILPPLIAVWKIEAQGPRKQKYWVISGDLPTDMSAESAAKNARDAVRYFSLNWQLKAENMLRSADNTQHQLAQIMVSKANGLAQLHGEDRLWGEMAVVI
ncbi:DUF4826 family protein [Ferrimonas pelagia]|uniref:DUF4826 family protein n=1 Tax=Ferrimonas pelagia TaxID=1177826 RepID=A0ABP9FL78_9GAMM